MPNLGLATLRVANREGRSVVVEQYSQAPLQLHRPLYLGGSLQPTVYLRSPSAGLLDGDEHRLRASVAAHCSLELRTQAATLVYPGSSSIDIEIDIDDCASLVFLPHQLILAKGAILRQIVKIHMRASSHLLYSEGWCAGRLAMGESFLFESFSNLLEIYVEGELSYREKWTLIPQAMPLDNLLLCGKNKKFSSIFQYGQSPELAIKLPNIAAPGQSEPDGLRWIMQRNNVSISRIASEC